MLMINVYSQHHTTYYICGSLLCLLFLKNYFGEKLITFYRNFGLFLSGMNFGCCVLVDLHGTCVHLHRESFKNVSQLEPWSTQVVMFARRGEDTCYLWLYSVSFKMTLEIFWPNLLTQFPKFGTIRIRTSQHWILSFQEKTHMWQHFLLPAPIF